MNEDLHNLFYYPNVCHVCKSLRWEVELKRCAGCKMIVYCGREHQKQHWPQHRDLCKTVTEVLKSSGKHSLFETSEENLDLKTWVKTKMSAMLLVSWKLGRKLENYEEQMFKFARSCVVCHKSRSDQLTDCEHCPSGSFCQDHLNDPVHSKMCSEFQVCFDLDISSSLFPGFMPNSVVPFHTEEAYLPRSISDFIDLYVNQDQEVLLKKQNYSARASEYLSRPLSLLYSLEKLQFTPNSDLTVHIIGANIIEASSIKVWEVLIHWVPFLENLKIVLVGPELANRPKEERVEICDYCQTKKLSLTVSMNNILYNDYLLAENFVKPDFVIGFNLGLHECEEIESPENTWRSSLIGLKGLDCPVILTSFTEVEAEQEHQRLCDNLGSNVKFVFQERNPFSSLRPYRDFESEGVYFANQFVTVYKNLRSS